MALPVAPVSALHATTAVVSASYVTQPTACAVAASIQTGRSACARRSRGGLSDSRVTVTLGSWHEGRAQHAGRCCWRPEVMSVHAIAMGTLTHLLILYAGLVLINSALSAALWLGTRERMHRDLFLVWGTCLISYVLQGALTQNGLVMTYAYASVFPVNLALASLLGRTLGLPVRWKPFAWAVVGAAALSTIIWLAGGAFT